jgi:hypothetical protein
MFNCVCVCVCVCVYVCVCVCVCDKKNSVHTKVFIVKFQWVKVKMKLEQTTLSLTSALDDVVDHRLVPAALCPA